jgi:hypothetical protein
LKEFLFGTYKVENSPSTQMFQVKDDSFDSNPMGLVINWMQWLTTYARFGWILKIKYISLLTIVAYGTSCMSSCLVKLMGLIVFVNLALKGTGVETCLQSLMWKCVRISKMYLFYVIKMDFDSLCSITWISRQ